MVNTLTTLDKQMTVLPKDSDEALRRMIVELYREGQVRTRVWSEYDEIEGVL